MCAWPTSVVFESAYAIVGPGSPVALAAGSQRAIDRNRVCVRARSLAVSRSGIDHRHRVPLQRTRICMRTNTTRVRLRGLLQQPSGSFLLRLLFEITYRRLSTRAGIKIRVSKVFQN